MQFILFELIFSSECYDSQNAYYLEGLSTYNGFSTKRVYIYYLKTKSVLSKNQ